MGLNVLVGIVSIFNSWILMNSISIQSMHLNESIANLLNLLKRQRSNQRCASIKSFHLTAPQFGRRSIKMSCRPSWKAKFFPSLFFCALGKSHKTWAPNSYVQHTLISVQIRKFDLRKLLFSVTNFLCLQNTLLIFYRYALNLKSDAKKFNVFSLCFAFEISNVFTCLLKP